MRPSMRLVSEAINSGAALVVSDDSQKAVEAALKSCTAPEYANAGFVPTTSLKLEAGAIADERLAQVSMLSTLKKIGMTVEVNESRLVLINAFTVCKAGVPLTSEQAKVLTHLHMKLDVFQPRIVATWVDDKFTK